MLKKVQKKRAEEKPNLKQELEKFKPLHEIHPTTETLNLIQKVRANPESYKEKRIDGIIVRTSMEEIWKIRKLNQSGTITKDPYKILEGQINFYKELYCSTTKDLYGPESSLFFDNPNIPKLTDDLKNLWRVR